LSFGVGHPLPFNFWEASGIKQSFVANTDALLSFTWKFLTDEGSVFDPRFYVLDGLLNMLNPNTALVPSPTPFAGEYSYETTTVFIPAGLHTIGFGVTDVADNLGNSGLLVDDISLRAVPESPSWLLFGLGLMGIATGRIVISRREHGQTHTR